MNRWYQKPSPLLETKNSNSLIHAFKVKGHVGLTINPYQGCQHRCGYCYATYEWSPEFYDRIYAKNNAVEVLETQLKSGKYETHKPVMISSATDAYQPAEIKYGITRRCVEVLQKYKVPYYVFTKSTIIERDLGLHRRYNGDCFIVWSLTTTNERIRRLLEPGTPPASSISNVIKKFVDAGVCCAVNIDPILPLITDSPKHLDEIVNACYHTGLKYVSGAILRLRQDIWERMKIILKLLNIENGPDVYKNTVYRFKDPLKPWFNVSANESYQTEVLQSLEEKVLQKGLVYGFPDRIQSRRINSPKNLSAGGEQVLLAGYM